MIAKTLTQLIAAVDLSTAPKDRFGPVRPWEAVLRGATLDDSLKRLAHALYDKSLSSQELQKNLCEKYEVLRESFSSQPVAFLNSLNEEIEKLKIKARVAKMEQEILSRTFEGRMLESFPELAHVSRIDVRNGYVVTYVPLAPNGGVMSQEKMAAAIAEADLCLA